MIANQRVFNFNAGPATLPLAVLETVHAEWFNWRGQGMALIELSHRSPIFIELMQGLESKLRQLLAIPDTYRIAFLSGPARAHFSMVPLNLLGTQKHAHYINTGLWSESAYHEAQRYVRECAITHWHWNEHGLKSLLPPEQWSIHPDSAYVYTAVNETVHGFLIPEHPVLPESIPLVTDATSFLLTQPMAIESFGLIFAGTQKNLGIAGLTVLIIREDLLDRAHPMTPAVWHYATQVSTQSLQYTPCTFACYLMDLVLDWVQAQGGLEALALSNQHKANLFYDYLDSTSFYHNPIQPEYRSAVNPVFAITQPDLEATFVEEAMGNQLVGLKGHRSAGGLRASFYNAMPLAGVMALIDFMREFETRYG